MKATLVTRVRSGGYGFTVKKNIFFAYLPIELAKQGNRFTMELIEGNREAEVTASVLYDPKGEKLKSIEKVTACANYVMAKSNPLPLTSASAC
jgi:glycine cleavage system aminomethyltransferase T